MNNVELAEAIRKIIDILGVDAFSDSKKFNSLLNDMSPQLIEERKIFHRGLTDKILMQISIIKNCQEDMRQIEAQKCRQMMINEIGLTDAWISTILCGFADAFGWNIDTVLVQTTSESNDTLVEDDSKVIPESTVPTVDCDYPAEVVSLLKRIVIFLEDDDFKNANEYCTRILDIMPECAEAYLYSFFADSRIKTLEDLKHLAEIPTNKNYERAKLYAGKSLKTDLAVIEKVITDRNNKNISLLLEPRKKATALRKLIIGKDAFRRIDGTPTSKRFNGIKEINDRYIIYNNGNVALRRGKINEYLNIMRWQNIASVSCDEEQYLGVRKDGTVTAISFKEYNDKDYGHTWIYDENGIHNLINHEWHNIEKAIVNQGNLIGLKKDGQVIFAGPCSHNIDLNKWSDIVDICCNKEYYVGLKKDGSVVVHPDNTRGFKNWSNIDKIFNYRSSIYGLTKQGTIVDEMNKPYSNWTDIVYVSSSADNIVALKLDGTVLADTGWYSDHPSIKNVSSWSDIVAVASFKDATIGIRKDGVVLSTEKNYSNFKLFDNADTLTSSSLQSLLSNDSDEKEKLQKIQNTENQIQQIKVQIEKQHKELSALGLFALKQKNEIKTQIESLETQLNNLDYEKNLLTGKIRQNRILSIATDYNWFALWHRWEYDLFSDTICPNYGWGSSYNLRFIMLLDQRIGVNSCTMNFSLYNENNAKVYEDVISFSDMNPDNTVLGFHWKPDLNFPSGEYYAVMKIDGVQEYVFNFTMMPQKN